MKCATCYQHRLEIKRLEALVRRLQASSLGNTPITPLSTAIGLTSQQEEMLEALWNAKGDAVSSSALSIMLGGQSNKESIRVQMCRIRNKLGSGCIENRYGAGYYLTGQGIKAVGDLMGETK